MDVDSSTLDSRLSQSLVDAARSSEARREYDAAAGYYRSAYERNPGDVEVVLGLSRNLRFIARPREAEAIVERALRGAPDEPRLLAERGKVHLANLEAAEAVEALSKAADALPQDWDVQTALAMSYDRLGLYDQAERHYQKALSLAPDNPIVLNNHGLSLAQRGNLREAIATLRRAASQPDATVQMRQNLALLHAVSGDLLRTEELVRRDLPPEIADENMAYYRRIAGNRRIADAGEAVRAAAEQVGPGGAPVAAAPLPPPSLEEGEPLMSAGDSEAVPPAAIGASSAAAGSLAPPAPPTDGKPVPLTPAAKPAASTAASPETAASPSGAGAQAPKERVAGPAAAGGPPGKEETGTTGKSAEKTAKAEAEKAADRPVGKTAGEQSESPAKDAADGDKTAGKTGESYQLQLASFRRQEQAEQARRQLLSRHKDVLGTVDLQVSRISLGSRGDYYRVLSTPFGTRNAAADLCQVLKTRRADCLLVRAETPAR